MPPRPFILGGDGLGSPSSSANISLSLAQKISTESIEEDDETVPKTALASNISSSVADEERGPNYGRKASKDLYGRDKPEDGRALNDLVERFRDTNPRQFTGALPESRRGSNNPTKDRFSQFSENLTQPRSSSREHRYLVSS